jgi:hypothetical protein
MTAHEERLANLRRRAEFERDDLAASLREMKMEAQAFRHRWRFAGLAASGLAAAGHGGVEAVRPQLARGESRPPRVGGVAADRPGQGSEEGQTVLVATGSTG